MELSDAIDLIGDAVDRSLHHQSWADLGAGDGLFTRALASLLGSGSTIAAIDRDASSLAKIRTGSSHVRLTTCSCDFTQDNWDVEQLDGVVMANSLHFVSDQLNFLIMLRKKLKPSGRIIFIEYERTASSPWVQYPVSFAVLKDLSVSAGFSSIVKVKERPSRYQGMMYSAWVNV